MLSMPIMLVLLSSAANPSGETVTYTKDVAPILWKHCASCHRPGEIGPFSLLNYRDAAKRADFLDDVVSERKMPPWKAEPGYGEFLDDRRLDDHEIDILSRWAEAGASEGDPKDLPPAPRFPEGWQLGTPDLVLEMPEPFEVHASGRDVFRCFVIPTNLTEERTVAAVEFRQGNRRVVHHALFFLDSTGAARAKDAADPGPGYASFGGIGVVPTGSLGGWAPGALPRPLPDGLGMRVAKNSDLILQVHYHPTGKVETDRSRVGIYFTKTPASRIVTAIPINNRHIQIPAGDSRHRITAEATLPTDVKAYGITPHMHWLGKEMLVTATLPDGSKRPLIRIKDWDFNWQGRYLFAKPVELPKGTHLDVQALYDNSAENPHNPSSPPREVRFGEQTTDEMCLCVLQVVPDHPEGYRDIRNWLRLRILKERATAKAAP